MMIILLATLVCGVGSVWVAWCLSRALLNRYQQHMLSLAAGALLATAFLHLLPEAFGSEVAPQSLFIALLIGLIFFFLLDKAELWHHGHEHSHDMGHSHHEHAGHDDAHHELSPSSAFRQGGWSVLLGDSVHAFGDGMLVAGAFMANVGLGCAATAAVLAHEIPHHMGDLVVLSQNPSGKGRALIKLTLSGAVTCLGGEIAFLLLEGRESIVPYILCIASSSYLYVALADLIPQLQKRLNARSTLAQIAWLFAGMIWVQMSIQWLS
jgi:zinc and cadmium transporter